MWYFEKVKVYQICKILAENSSRFQHVPKGQIEKFLNYVQNTRTNLKPLKINLTKVLRAEYGIAKKFALGIGFILDTAYVFLEIESLKQPWVGLTPPKQKGQVARGIKSTVEQLFLEILTKVIPRLNHLWKNKIDLDNVDSLIAEPQRRPTRGPTRGLTRGLEFYGVRTVLS